MWIGAGMGNGLGPDEGARLGERLGQTKMLGTCTVQGPVIAAAVGLKTVCIMLATHALFDLGTKYVSRLFRGFVLRLACRCT